MSQSTNEARKVVGNKYEIAFNKGVFGLIKDRQLDAQSINLAQQNPLLMAKLLCLRGLNELSGDELLIYYRASYELFISLEENSHNVEIIDAVAEQLHNFFPPFSHDFSDADCEFLREPRYRGDSEPQTTFIKLMSEVFPRALKDHAAGSVAIDTLVDID